MTRKLLAHFNREVARMNRALDTYPFASMEDFWRVADEYWRANQARLYLARRLARVK